MVAQIKGGTHDAPSVDGDSPAARTGNLGDQTMSAEATKYAAKHRKNERGFPSLADPGSQERCHGVSHKEAQNQNLVLVFENRRRFSKSGAGFSNPVSVFETQHEFSKSRAEF